MTSEQLAAGYSVYATTDELAQDAASPREGGAASPTTSIATTVCITATGYDQTA